MCLLPKESCLIKSKNECQDSGVLFFFFHFFVSLPLFLLTRGKRLCSFFICTHSGGTKQLNFEEKLGASGSHYLCILLKFSLCVNACFDMLQTCLHTRKNHLSVFILTIFPCWPITCNLVCITEIHIQITSAFLIDYLNMLQHSAL